MKNSKENKQFQIIEMASYRKAAESFEKADNNIIMNLSECLDASVLQAEIVASEAVGDFPTWEFQEKSAAIQNAMTVLAFLNKSGLKHKVIREAVKHVVRLGVREMTAQARLDSASQGS